MEAVRGGGCMSIREFIRTFSFTFPDFCYYQCRSVSAGCLCRAGRLCGGLFGWFGRHGGGMVRGFRSAWFYISTVGCTLLL